MMFLNKRCLSVFLLAFFFSACTFLKKPKEGTPKDDAETTETTVKEAKEKEKTPKKEKKSCLSPFASKPKKKQSTPSLKKAPVTKRVDLKTPITKPKEEIPSLERRIITLEEKIRVLNKKLDSLNKQALETLETMKARQQLDSRNIDQLREKILLLSREIQELDNKYARRFDIFESMEIAKDKATYEKAQKLYRSGNYVDAVIMFKKYISFFPKSSLADNAQYWIGEGYYSQKAYSRAAEEFGKVADFPDKSKLPDALLRKGYCYLHLKMYTKARKLFSKILNEFSNNQAEYAIVDSARRKLEEIKGKK